MDGKDERTGRFLPGNRFWEARSSHGAHPKFETAEALWDACLEYFEWNEANPLYEDKLVTYQGDVKHEPSPKMRAMTLQGLCLFIDVSISTWNEWRNSRPDLSEVMTRAEAVIYSQKFAGAAAEMLNANIIARDLGLAEKSNINHGVQENTDIAALRARAKQIADALGITLPPHITGEAEGQDDDGQDGD